MLEGLTEGNHAPWCLLVDDSKQPAFMQPPVRTDEMAKEFSPKADTPDDLDVLQTAKNHDVKTARMVHSGPEDWVYALISLQTMTGFMGAGNQGIARMNGGSGSRPCVGIITNLEMSERWMRDTPRVLAHRNSLLAPDWPYSNSGLSLLWCVPWDGSTQLAVDSLDPLFIEVARRVRLTEENYSITALGAGCKKTRIAAKDLKGNLGDPWTPITKKTGGALTVPAAGFTPSLLRDLLLDETRYQPAAMQTLEPGDTSVWFRASVIAGGQGKTDGYHEAMIPVGRRPRFALAGGPDRDRLTRLSKWALDQAGTAQYRVLKPALFMLIEGGPEGFPDTNKTEAGHWVSHFTAVYSARWGEIYFPWLWEALDLDDETAKANWHEQLYTMAHEALEAAMDSAPRHTGRRYRGQVRADGLFNGLWKKHFPTESSTT